MTSVAVELGEEEQPMSSARKLGMPVVAGRNFFGLDIVPCLLGYGVAALGVERRLIFGDPCSHLDPMAPEVQRCARVTSVLVVPGLLKERRAVGDQRRGPPNLFF